MANAATRPILILGGGIGGLTLAGCLEKMGLPYLVLEQAPELGEVGAGIQISPNGVHVMRYLGVDQALDRVAGKPTVYHSRDWKTAGTLYTTPRNPEFAEKYGAPYYQVHRADLLNLIASSVSPDNLRLGRRARSVHDAGDHVVVETETGERFEGAVAIGADGIHSIVRAHLFGADSPRWTGIMMFRLTTALDKLPPRFADFRAGTYQGPNGHITTYPLSGHSRINFAGAWETEQWEAESWSLECSKEEVHEAYKGWHPDLHELIENTERVNKWALFDRDPLPKWTEGRLTILGDAAHPMLPFMAQGACMAIEDAYVLAALLKRGADDWPAALVAYEEARRPRTAKVQLGARSRVKSMHEPSAVGRLLRNMKYWVGGLTGSAGGGNKRFNPDWVYEVNVVADYPVGDRSLDTAA